MLTATVLRVCRVRSCHCICQELAVYTILVFILIYHLGLYSNQSIGTYVANRSIPATRHAGRSCCSSLSQLNCRLEDDAALLMVCRAPSCPSSCHGHWSSFLACIAVLDPLLDPSIITFNRSIRTHSIKSIDSSNISWVNQSFDGRSCVHYRCHLVCT